MCLISTSLCTHVSFTIKNNLNHNLEMLASIVIHLSRLLYLPKKNKKTYRVVWRKKGGKNESFLIFSLNNIWPLRMAKHKKGQDERSPKDRPISNRMEWGESMKEVHCHSTIGPICHTPSHWNWSGSYKTNTTCFGLNIRFCQSQGLILLQS